MPCKQLKLALADGGVLIDVRTPAEFARGAIRGAINIPLNLLTASLDTFEMEKPVLLYCHSGARSGMAQRYLVQAGYDAHNIGAYLPFAQC